MVAAALWLNAYSLCVSVLSARFDESDFSVFMGLIVGGLVYFPALTLAPLLEQVSRAPVG